MIPKIAKQIYIEPQQELLLQEALRQTGLSETELLSQAIAKLLEQFCDRSFSLAVWESEKAFIKSVKQRSPLAGGRDWKREDLYEQ